MRTGGAFGCGSGGMSASARAFFSIARCFRRIHVGRGSTNVGSSTPSASSSSSSSSSTGSFL